MKTGTRNQILLLIVCGFFYIPDLKAGVIDSSALGFTVENTIFGDEIAQNYSLYSFVLCYVDVYGPEFGDVPAGEGRHVRSTSVSSMNLRLLN